MSDELNNEASQKLQTAGGAEREADEIMDAVCDGRIPTRAELKKKVHELLAACANEARLEEQTNYPAPHRHSASLQQDYDRLVADCPRCKRIAELKRAVAGNDAAPMGEKIRALKAAPAPSHQPQGGQHEN